MAFTDIPPFWVPSSVRMGIVNPTGNYVMDATGEIAALVFRVPKTGTLTRFECYVFAVGNVPNNGLTFSFQDVAGTGLPDGVADQSATTAANIPAAAGWFSPGDFGSTRSVTQGDLLACVIGFTSFTASDSVTIGGASMFTTLLGFPYGVSATSTKQNQALPVFALRYNDSTYAFITGDLWPVESATFANIDTGTTPDEFGTVFEMPVKCRLKAVRWEGLVPAAGDYDIVIYDSDGTTPLTTQACDGDATGIATLAWHRHWLDTAVTIEANTAYRAIIKPQTTNNLNIYYGVFNSLALMGAVEGGTSWYATERTNAGSWTDYNTGTFRRARISLMFDGVEVSGSSSTGGSFTFVG